ncbi:FAD-dependent monooxygenase [Nigerium massiliense]|uniref:FAD-dependent monooxygenase n=1 Tax=Nigerium massiliense TaxID=1522317 RepID=UPI0009E3DBB1|nr:FAD-dependent monooxygenase [Nigerium massiliense]
MTQPVSPGGPAAATSTLPRVEVIVIGAGFGGLAAAVCLARRGVSVRVYDRVKKLGEVGAGMQVAPNCSRVLRDIGLLDETRALGVVPQKLTLMDAVAGQTLSELDLARVEERYGAPFLVIHRSDLHGVLLRAALKLDVDLRTQMKCVAYSSSASGGRVEFANGTTDEADVVIAADGLHSLARPFVVDDEPVDSGYVSYRGAMPASVAASAGVRPQEVTVYAGPGCHLVQYGVRPGELVNQMAVFRAPEGVRGRVGAEDLLKEAFAGALPVVQRSISLLWRERCWPMIDRDPVRHWISGRVALLGDAAHASLQYLAQGAGMAIEDAWVLAEHATAHRDADGHVDWDAALRAYDTVRPEHCRRVVQAGRELGELWHAEGRRRDRRNVVLPQIDLHSWAFTDWLWGPPALTPQQEAPPFQRVPLEG